MPSDWSLQMTIYVMTLERCSSTQKNLNSHCSESINLYVCGQIVEVGYDAIVSLGDRGRKPT